MTASYVIPCIGSPQVQRAHHRHRRPQHVSRCHIYVCLSIVFTSVGLSIHLPHIPVSLMILLRLPQLPAVPDYYAGPPGVSYVGRQHPAHIGGEATLTLPQIEAKSYHPHPSHPHLSTYPSGLTSMVVSNKSTSHGAYLPTIYGEKTSAKVGRCLE